MLQVERPFCNGWFFGALLGIGGGVVVVVVVVQCRYNQRNSACCPKHLDRPGRPVVPPGLRGRDVQAFLGDGALGVSWKCEALKRNHRKYIYFAYFCCNLEEQNRRGFSKHITSWWFQTCFIFTTIWGRFPFWLIIFFWNGLKPPTRSYIVGDKFLAQKKSLKAFLPKRCFVEFPTIYNIFRRRGSITGSVTLQFD